MSMEISKEYMVMLPMMGHGHLIPFLALARNLQQKKGITITIANTPLNIQYLRSNMTEFELESSKVRLVELPFRSTDHGLPPNAENSENLTLDQIGLLIYSTSALEDPFRKHLCDLITIEGKPPLCLITDVYFGWSNEVAKDVGTVNVTFSTFGAYGTLAYFSLWLNLPFRSVDSQEFSVPGFPDECLFHVSQLHPFMKNADGTDLWSRFWQQQISLCTKSFGLLCNASEEIEPQALEWLRNYFNLRVWGVGPLLPPCLVNGFSCHDISSQRYKGKSVGISAETCIEWLDKQSPGSVLYISFGSQNTVSQSQMMELAIGLEESGRTFIWVIRPPIGSDKTSGFITEWLPVGFAERIVDRNRGLVVENWAPQLEILMHKSVGAFLSHCGWNSIMESLSQGVPIIGWPIAAEQPYNSKLLVEELGVALELTRGVDSNLTSDEVKMVIEMVMNKDSVKGNDMKRKAMEFREHIRDAMKDDGESKSSSAKSLDDLINTLTHGTKHLKHAN